MKSRQLERGSPLDRGHAHAAAESYRRWNELTPAQRALKLLGTDGKPAPPGLALKLRRLQLQEMKL